MQIFARVLLIAALLLQTPLCKAEVQQVEKEKFSGALWLTSITLFSLPVWIGAAYGLSKIRYANDAVGALYLLPLIIAAPEEDCVNQCRWQRNSLRGGLVALSATNFVAWGNDKISKEQLFVNNAVGLAAAFGFSQLVGHFGFTSKSNQIVLIPGDQSLTLSLQHFY